MVAYWSLQYRGAGKVPVTTEYRARTGLTASLTGERARKWSPEAAIPEGGRAGAKYAYGQYQ